MIYSAIASVWIGSAAYRLTVVFSTTAVINGACLSHMIFKNVSIKLFYVIWYVVSFYIIIIFIFIFSYGRILIVIRRQAKVMASHSNRQSSTIHSQLNQIQTNVIKTMIIVSAFYAVMWFPNVVVLFYFFLFSRPNTLMIVIYYVSLYCQFLYTCTNPFIYAFKFDPVKQVLIRIISCTKTSEETNESIANAVPEIRVAVFHAGHGHGRD